MFVTVLLNNKPTSVYAEEASSLIERGLAKKYPPEPETIEDVKAEKTQIENKMIESAPKNKREKKAK